jgi:hypothetical protein
MATDERGEGEVAGLFILAVLALEEEQVFGGADHRGVEAGGRLERRGRLPDALQKTIRA